MGRSKRCKRCLQLPLGRSKRCLQLPLIKSTIEFVLLFDNLVLLLLLDNFIRLRGIFIRLGRTENYFIKLILLALFFQINV